MTQATQMTPIEIQERILGLNRKQRRQVAREHWTLMQPWKDPEYQHLSRSDARKVSWENYWSAFKYDCIKEVVDKQVMADALTQEYPKALRPFIRFICRWWGKLTEIWSR